MEYSKERMKELAIDIMGDDYPQGCWDILTDESKRKYYKKAHALIDKYDIKEKGE